MNALVQQLHPTSISTAKTTGSSPFGGLPIELTPLIISLALPPRSRSTLAERRTLLNAFCLVSPAWKLYAQPLLFEQIETPLRSTIDDFTWRLEGHYHEVQAIHLRPNKVMEGVYRHRWGLIGLLRKCFKVEEVWIEANDVMETMTTFARLDFLTHLHIYSMETRAIPQPTNFRLDSLTRLSLSGAVWALLPLLAGLRLPNLQALSIWETAIDNPHFGAFFDRFAPQLTSLILGSLCDDEHTRTTREGYVETPFPAIFFAQCRNLNHLTVPSFDQLRLASSLPSSLTSIRITRRPLTRINEATELTKHLQILSAEPNNELFIFLSELQRLVVPVVDARGGVLAKQKREMLRSACEIRGVRLVEMNEMEDVEELVSK